jgi:hypothetical protein
MGFILMYDVTNEESFSAVQDWYLINLLLMLNLNFGFVEAASAHARAY